MNVLTKLSTGMVAALMSLSTYASTVQLVPSQTQVDVGQTFSVDLFLDAADAPGGDPGAFQGFTVVSFDQSLVTYNDFVFNDPAVSFGGPPSAAPGQVTIGFDNALAGVAGRTGVIGTFSFTAAGDVGDTIVLGIRDLFPTLGTFVNTVPTITPINPDFVGTEVSVVPLPATVWLMLSGLACLGGYARRKAGAF